MELDCLSQDMKAKPECPDLTHLAGLNILHAGSQEMGDEGCPNIQFTQSTSGLGRTHCRFLEIPLQVQTLPDLADTFTHSSLQYRRKIVVFQLPN